MLRDKIKFWLAQVLRNYFQ